MTGVYRTVKIKKRGIVVRTACTIRYRGRVTLSVDQYTHAWPSSWPVKLDVLQDVLGTEKAKRLALECMRTGKRQGKSEAHDEAQRVSLRCVFERRWFVLKRPRRDMNGKSETEVTVTSKRHVRAERTKR